MSCQNCESDRIFKIDGKCSDLCSALFKGQDVESDYAPYIDNVCGGDYIRVTVCLECGQVQGKFPVESPDMPIEDDEDY